MTRNGQPTPPKKPKNPHVRCTAYQFRIYPTKKQIGTLEWTLRRCKELYNAALQERREAYQMCGVSISYRMQANQLPAIKQLREEYQAIHSQVQQDVLTRLDKAMQAFFRRVMNGETPGYPVRRIVSRFRAQPMLLELMESSMHASLTLNLERGGRPEHARTVM